MEQFLKIFFAFIFTNILFGQQVDDSVLKNKSNPILFIEGFGGVSVLKNIGYSTGIELNYQNKMSLFSFRYIDITGFTQNRSTNINIEIPDFIKTYDDNEYGFLYGRRWIINNHSYSVSAGISYNNYHFTTRDEDWNYFSKAQNYYGVPFEANVKWFPSKKRKKLISHAVIPRIGLKLFGSFSSKSFIGVGISVGLGFHKKY